MTRVGIDGPDRPEFEAAIGRLRQQVIDEHAPRVGQRRHAVIGDNHQVCFQITRGKSRPQAADRGVNDRRRGIHLGRIRPEPMARAVDDIEIERHQLRPIGRRQLQPAQQHVDAEVGRERLVEVQRRRLSERA